MSESIRRSAQIVVDYYLKHGRPDPDWPADLSFALASEVLILLDGLEEVKRLQDELDDVTKALIMLEGARKV